MKKVKRILAIVLVFTLLFSLAGCSLVRSYSDYEVAESKYNDAVEIMKDADKLDIAVTQGVEYVTPDGNIFSLKSVKIKNALMAPLGGLYFLSYIAIVTGGLIVTPGITFSDSESKFMCLVLEYTNASDEVKYFSDLDISSVAQVGKRYFVPSQTIVRAGKMSFGDAKTKIKPGKSRLVYLYFTAPKDDLKTASPIKILFNVENQPYMFTYRTN